MSNFTPEERELLNKYISNVDGDVYVVHDLPGVTGAVYARYSRARTSFKETLLKEFVQDGQIDPNKADKLIERVLIAYGDDSVGELDGAHISYENISVLATKEIEDRRIGGSPIEKSTRYVFFEDKDENGFYKYYRDPKIMNSRFKDKYIETMDFVFDTYKSLIEPMQEFYKQKFPIEEAEYDILGTGTKQKLSDLTKDEDIKAFNLTYKIDSKTKACDSLRSFLPIAVKTNVGLFGNGRFYQWLISHLLSSSLDEVKQLGEKSLQELSKFIRQYVRRSKAKEYNLAIDKNMQTLADGLFKEIAPETEYQPVTLMPLALRNTEEYLIAHMLYQYTEISFLKIYEMVKGFDRELKDKIKNTYVGERITRRDRPGRAFESGYTYTFDLTADFGTYKDLMRHRVTSQIRQVFSPRHGMVIPKDISEAGFADKALACHERVLNLYNEMVGEIGLAASYLTLHGSRVRWIMSYNDREAMHLLELRSGKQGHPQYRKLSQQMHNAIAEMDPWRASIMKFVDHNDYTSARGDSEAKQRVKEKQLGITTE